MSDVEAAVAGGGTPRRIFVVTPGFEQALLAELRVDRSAESAEQQGRDALSVEMPGLVLAPDDDDLARTRHASRDGEEPRDPVFARQQLPNAVLVAGTSVASLVENAYAATQAAVDAAAGAFTIHAFVPSGAGPALGSRAALIGSQLLALLRQRRRRAARLYVPPESAETGFSDIKLVIQVLLADRDRAWISAAAPQRLRHGGWDISPWIGGIAPVADDRTPPSRAYRKLEEAFAWLGDEPRAGQLCVDLGGSPGGWAYTALRRGAQVIAVDRSPLAPALLAARGLTMVQGNAFTYQPPPSRIPVDWLLSDVICEPARALALIRNWLDPGWCRRLVVTVKFKGQEGYSIVDEVKTTLQEMGCPRWRLKHLHHNKNEITVMAFANSRRAEVTGKIPGRTSGRTSSNATVTPSANSTAKPAGNPPTQTRAKIPPAR